jgi:hypothetical protein
MKHYTFGSSTAARTDVCQQWRAQSAGIPVGESSFALDGTIVHAMLEARALDDLYDFEAQVNTPLEGGFVTRDLVELAQEMWVATEELLKKHGAVEWEAETTGSAAEDIGGTLDMIASCPTKALLIDYKSGMGVQVSPVNNKQILFAAAVCEIESGAADLLAPHDNFVGVIIQPNSGGHVEVREWEFTRDQVDLFWDKHVTNINLARKGEGALKAGKHCKFCPANGFCDATNGNMLRMKQLDPTKTEQLLEGLALIEAVNSAISNLEKIAYQQLEVGTELKGWKLVKKRATEKWKDADAALKSLRRAMGGKKHIMKETLLSPAQMRALAKKQGVVLDLEALTVKESSGTTLAPESDKRDAVLSVTAFAEALAAVH